jgi:hypothetical protein
MSIQITEKQRRAVDVVKTALIGAGISGRSICVQADSWLDRCNERRVNFAVFVQSGGEDEPFYVQGSTLVEAVKNMLASIKGRINGATTEISKAAPF